MVHNPSIQEAEVGGLLIHDQPGSIARPCLKKQTKKINNGQSVNYISIKLFQKRKRKSRQE
jgi:hypothetical protein